VGFVALVINAQDVPLCSDTTFQEMNLRDNTCVHAVVGALSHWQLGITSYATYGEEDAMVSLCYLVVPSALTNPRVKSFIFTRTELLYT